MAASLERFQALIENSSDALSLLNAEGQVLYASASIATVLGYLPEELLGQNGLDLLHPQDRDRCVLTLKEVVAEPRRVYRMQVRVRQKDGQWRWVESTASNLLDEPSVRAIAINYRDIGTRRAEEESRQQLIEELIRSNAELQCFAHTVAHDLREPLRTITAFTEILVRRGQLQKEDRELAQTVVAGAHRMSTVLEGLLRSAASSFHDALGPVDLERAVAQALQHLSAALASSGATINVQRLPRVHGNESDLVRVFENLISNAVKYRSQRAIEVRIDAERLGPDWVIRIHDNGIGIPTEHHRHVFGLFTRLHGQKVSGAGVGLSVCKKAVEAMGGTIWVDSEPGAGSTFCFTVGAESAYAARTSN